MNLDFFIKKIKGFSLNNSPSLLYYSFVLLIVSIAVLSTLFPYKLQNFFYKYITPLYTRSQTLRVVISGNLEYDRMCISPFINNVSKIHNKILLKTVECEKDSSPADMLRKGKGDLAIVSSVSCLPQDGKIKAISLAGEKVYFVFAPKNYGFNEFNMLAGRKIGFLGDIPTGIYITERLISYYRFDVPPELYKQKIYDVEKSFSSGEIEAVVWVEGYNTSQIQDFISKNWYQIVPIQQAEEFINTLPFLFAKNINTPHNGTIKFICIRNILAVSNRVSNFVVQNVIEAWFNSEFVLASHDYESTFLAFHPPAFLDIHPIALEFFNMNKPITKSELKTLGYSFFIILVCILLLKRTIQIWSQKRNKPYEQELEKRWEEVRALQYQWDTELRSEEILIRLKKLKSIYNWTLESYKHGFITEKAVMTLYMSILYQILDFSERYFDYWEKKKILSDFTTEETNTKFAQTKDTEEENIQTPPKIYKDDKDKYLKVSTTQQVDKKLEQQMLLFNFDEEKHK